MGRSRPQGEGAMSVPVIILGCGGTGMRVLGGMRLLILHRLAAAMPVGAWPDLRFTLIDFEANLLAGPPRLHAPTLPPWSVHRRDLCNWHRCNIQSWFEPDAEAPRYHDSVDASWPRPAEGGGFTRRVCTAEDAASSPDVWHRAAALCGPYQWPRQAGVGPAALPPLFSAGGGIAAAARCLPRVMPERRIFVVASCAGGTGSGMLIDLAHYSFLQEKLSRRGLTCEANPRDLTIVISALGGDLADEDLPDLRAPGSPHTSACGNARAAGALRQPLALRIKLFMRRARRLLTFLAGSSPPRTLPEIVQAIRIDPGTGDLLTRCTAPRAGWRARQDCGSLAPPPLPAVDGERFRILFGPMSMPAGIEEAYRAGLWLGQCLRGPGELLSPPARIEPERLALALQALAADPKLRELSASAAWIEKVGFSCQHATHVPVRRAGMRQLTWSPRARLDFYLNRFFTYDQLVPRAKGLTALGGFPQALALALEVLLRQLSRCDLDVRMPRRKRQRSSAALAWSVTFAALQGIEIRWDALEDFEALLVRTQRRAVIHLRKDLDLEHRALGVCHELAHGVLAHTPNSAYGFDPQNLAAAERELYQGQEEEADALASLWLHLFSGLAEISWGLARFDSRLVLANSSLSVAGTRLPAAPAGSAEARFADEWSKAG